jgi:hypothetical protein
MPRYSANYTSSLSSSSSSKSSSAHTRRTRPNTPVYPTFQRDRYRRKMSFIASSNNHAEWEAVILSQQYARYLDLFFKEKNDYSSAIIIQQIRTADLIAVDLPTITAHCPITVSNLIHVHRKIKALSFSLLDATQMNEAVQYAYEGVCDMPELVSDSPAIRMMRIDEPEEITPGIASPLPPSSPSIEYTDTDYTLPHHPGTPPDWEEIYPTHPSIDLTHPQSIIFHPITVIKEETSPPSPPRSPLPSLPPLTLSVDPCSSSLPPIETLTPSTKIEDKSPSVSPIDLSAYSEPPHSDPKYRDIDCRNCGIHGHRQANCIHYHCRICCVNKPGHLTPFCPYQGKFDCKTVQGRIPHLAFNFPLNAYQEGFFNHLDKWEAEDDNLKNAKTCESLIRMHLGCGVDPISIEQIEIFTQIKWKGPNYHTKL